MPLQRCRMIRRAGSAAMVALAAACGGDGPTTAEPDLAPEITVSGVEDGATYEGPVAFEIAVDRGTYSATLNGEPLVGSRHTVNDYGDFDLRVTARNGAATAEREIGFSIVLAGPVGTTIRVLDLGPNDAGGGGDAVLVADSADGAGFHILIDAGPAGADGRDEDFVVDRLAALGIDTLEALVLSHAHADHFGGMDEVLAGVHVRRFVYNGQARGLSYYQQVLQVARARADTVIVPDSVLRLRLAPGDAGTEIVIIPPLDDYIDVYTDDGHELNEGSLGVLLRRAGEESFEMFLAGDGEVEANRRWRTDFAALTTDVDILKVGHHGANNAIFDNGFSGRSLWMEHVDPEVALISANGTTHARLNALDYLLARRGLRTLCTNVHGEIVVRISSTGAYQVVPQTAPGAECEPGSEATTDLVPLP